MNKNAVATVDVLRPVMVPAGEMLDGEVLACQGWAMPGQRTLRLGLVLDRGWEDQGCLEIHSVGGKPYVWAACCNGEHA